MKITPGPWVADYVEYAEDIERNHWRILAGPEDDMFELVEEIGSCRINEAGNAHLLSAAPELLEACRLVAKKIDGEFIPSREIRDAVMAAVAKAEGRTCEIMS